MTEEQKQKRREYLKKWQKDHYQQIKEKRKKAEREKALAEILEGTAQIRTKTLIERGI